jgi:hypothetical protein
MDPHFLLSEYEGREKCSGFFFLNKLLGGRGEK